MNKHTLAYLFCFTLLILFLGSCDSQTVTQHESSRIPPTFTPLPTTASATSVAPTVTIESPIELTTEKANVMLSPLEEAVLQGNWTAIIEVLEREDAGASDPVSRLIMGHAYLATNRNNAAMLLFLSVRETEDIKSWADWTDSLLQNHPENFTALYFSGDANARQGNFEKAREVFTKVIDFQGDVPLALNARGILNVILNDWDNALLDLDKATKLAPDFADAYANLGTYWVLREVPDGALAAFNRALDINPEFALAYNGRGAAHFGNGEYEDAARDFQAAFQFSPILLMAEINQEFASANTSQLIILANMENKPGTTFETMIQQYPSILQERQAQFDTLSIQPELLTTNFSFIQPEELSSLTNQYGSESVMMAMVHDFSQSQSRFANFSLQMRSELNSPEVRAARPFINLNLANRLTTIAHSTAFTQPDMHTGQWSSYTAPLAERFGNLNPSQGTSISSPMLEWSRELRQSATQDLMTWTIDTPISAVLPDWINHIRTGSDMVNSITAGPGRTPTESLDRLAPMASLGGPMGGLLIPFLKGYYGIVFESFGSVDIRMQMASLNQHYQPPPATIHQPPDHIPSFFTSIERPVTDIGALASTIDSQIRPLETIERRALIVSEDQFRLNLLQSELNQRGIETWAIPPGGDPLVEAERWGANVIVGIGGIPSTNIQPLPPSTQQNWDWGQTFIPNVPQTGPGGISTEELAKAFVDRGNWPVITSFSLFYGLYTDDATEEE